MRSLVTRGPYLNALETGRYKALYKLTNHLYFTYLSYFSNPRKFPVPISGVTERLGALGHIDTWGHFTMSAVTLMSL